MKTSLRVRGFFKDTLHGNVLSDKEEKKVPHVSFFELAF
jgi:hypothetical protein